MIKGLFFFNLIPLPAKHCQPQTEFSISCTSLLDWVRRPKHEFRAPPALRVARGACRVRRNSGWHSGFNQNVQEEFPNVRQSIVVETEHPRRHFGGAIFDRGAGLWTVPGDYRNTERNCL